MALFNDPDNAAAANKIAQGAINGTLSIYNQAVQNIGNNRAQNSLEQAAYQGTTDNLFDFFANKTRFENLDRSIDNTNFYSDARTGDQLQDDIHASMGKMKEMNQGLRPMSAGQMWASAGSKALQGAALGASIGSFFPGAGTLIGGAIGTAVGGVMGAFQRGKQRRIARSNIKAQNAYERMSDGMEQTLNNIDNYELQNMGYNTFAEGGFPMPAQGDQGMPSASTEFNTGGIHETNPYGGIPIGKAPDGKPNLVEEGEVRLNNSNYILSNRLIIDKKSAEEMGLPKKYIGKTFAEAYKMRTKDYKNSENDPITKKGLQAEEERFIQGQEAAKQKLAPQSTQISPEEQAMLNQQMAQNMPSPEAVGAGMQDSSMIPQQGGVPAEQADPAMMAEQGMMAEQAVNPEEAMMAEQGMMAYGGHIFAGGGSTAPSRFSEVGLREEAKKIQNEIDTGKISYQEGRLRMIRLTQRSGLNAGALVSFVESIKPKAESVNNTSNTQTSVSNIPIQPAPVAQINTSTPNNTPTNRWEKAILDIQNKVRNGTYTPEQARNEIYRRGQLYGHPAGVISRYADLMDEYSSENYPRPNMLPEVTVAGRRPIPTTPPNAPGRYMATYPTPNNTQRTNTTPRYTADPNDNFGGASVEQLLSQYIQDQMQQVASGQITHEQALRNSERRAVSYGLNPSIGERYYNHHSEGVTFNSNPWQPQSQPENTPEQNQTPPQSQPRFQDRPEYEQYAPRLDSPLWTPNQSEQQVVPTTPNTPPTQQSQSVQPKRPSGPEKYYIRDHDMSATRTDVWRDAVANWNQANVDIPGTTEHTTYMRFKQLTDPNSPMYNARFANSASAKKVGDFSNPEAIKEMLSDGKWGVMMESFTHMVDPAASKLGGRDQILKPKTVEDELGLGTHPMSKYTVPADNRKEVTGEPKEASEYERGVQGAPVDKAGLGINYNVPIAGLGLMRAYRPVDYTHANHIEDLPNGLKRANYTPLNNYMTPQYIDQQYLDAQHAAAANAGTRALVQAGAASPNSSAALLANNVNNQAARGQNRLMAMQANNMEDKTVAQHNLGVDQANAQMYQNNSQFNTGQYNQARLNTGMTASQLRLQQDQAREQNIDDSWASLGNVLQRDRSDRMKYNMILNNDNIYYDPIDDTYKRMNNSTMGTNSTQQNTQPQQNTQYQEPAIISVNGTTMPSVNNTQNNTSTINTNGNNTPQSNTVKKKDNFDLNQSQGSNNTQNDLSEAPVNTLKDASINTNASKVSITPEKDIDYIEPPKLPEASEITQTNSVPEVMQNNNIAEIVQPQMPKMAPELNIQDLPMGEEDLHLLNNAELNDTYFMPNINAGINPDLLKSEIDRVDNKDRREQNKFFNKEYRDSVKGIINQPNYRKGLDLANEMQNTIETENEIDNQSYNNLLDQEMQEFNNEYIRRDMNNFTPDFNNIEDTLHGLNPTNYTTGNTIFPEVSNEELYNKLNPSTEHINNNNRNNNIENNNIGDDIRNYYLMENAMQLGRNANYDLNNSNSPLGFNSQGGSILNMDLYKKHKALETNLKSLETERRIKEANGDTAGVAAVDQQIANNLPSVEVSEDPNCATVLTDTQRRIANGGSVISSDNTSEKTSIFDSSKFKNTNFAKQRREIKELNERSKKGGTKEQVDVITFANQHNTQPWYVLDKKTNSLTRYEWKDGKLTTDSITEGITIGINKGDDMTVTYTNEDGSIKNKAGNLMTGAGIFEIGSIYQDPHHYGGTKQYALVSAVTGLEGPMANHLYNFERGLRGSNGCPTFSAEAYAHLSTWDMKSGQKYYILPEDEGNFFYMNGDTLKLSSSNPKVNRGGKGASNVVKPMDITMKNLKEEEQQVRMKNVEVIMEDPEFRNEFKEAFNLSDTQYNNVMLLTGAVMGKESNYGETGSFIADIGRVIKKAIDNSSAGPKVGGFLDKAVNSYKDFQTSSGYGQIFSKSLRNESKVYSGITEVNKSNDKRLSKVKAKNNEPLSFVNTENKPITLNTFKKENPKSWEAMTEAEQKAVSAYIEQNASNYKKYKYLAKYDMLRNQDYAEKQKRSNAMNQTSWYKKQNLNPVNGAQHDAAGSTISTMAMVASVISRLGSLGQDITDEMLEAFAKQYNGSGNYIDYAAGLKKRLLGDNIFIE